ncbi:hypothetical protein [Fluviicola chungangensis]|uniref:Uncharacterized protein n=1 Tax=Fluviicola chungangensis TaxID=2597671 RepID=A0A556MYI8_9FLAO|nr:hypothetical protein [Fluviicola chungangensis]TSJ44982.1 hypothetical protein FO442_10320 [Fluviicola chungangensis]
MRNDFMSHFYYLSDLGEVALPSEKEIQELEEKESSELLIILDSCVCLDIITFVKHKKSAKVDKTKIFNLVRYVQKHKVNYTSIFALTELCYDRSTLEIIEDKLWDFKHKVDFVFGYPIKLLERYEFDFELNYDIRPRTSSMKGSIQPFSANLNLYYAGLLKIRELANDGLKKEYSEKNINLFIEWMKNELNVMLGLEFTLALEIFGGNTKLLSMISIGAKPEQVKKRLWGTAWDLFHARMSCNRTQISKMTGIRTHPIFITKDYALYKVMAPSVLHNVHFNSLNFKITHENNYPLHYSDLFMQNLNERLLELSVERVSEEPILDESRVISIIENLEANL